MKEGVSACANVCLLKLQSCCWLLRHLSTQVPLSTNYKCPWFCVWVCVRMFVWVFFVCHCLSLFFHLSLKRWEIYYGQDKTSDDSSFHVPRGNTISLLRLPRLPVALSPCTAYYRHCLRRQLSVFTAFFLLPSSISLDFSLWMPCLFIYFFSSTCAIFLMAMLHILSPFKWRPFCPPPPGHGYCSCGRCICEEGWFGKLCQFPRSCDMSDAQSKELCETSDGVMCSGKGEKAVFQYRLVKVSTKVTFVIQMFYLVLSENSTSALWTYTIITKSHAFKILLM